MPNKTILNNLSSIEIIYNYFHPYKDGQLETNVVVCKFTTKWDAYSFFDKALPACQTDNLISIRTPSVDTKSRFGVDFSINPILLAQGKKGVDILDWLEDHFSDLPDELIVSVYDIEAPNCTRKVGHILFSERQQLRQPFSTFELKLELETKLRNSNLAEQLSQCCGSPVTAFAQQHDNKENHAFEIRCVDSGTAKTLRATLFALANEANLFHLISFKPSMDGSDCSFVLIQKPGLLLSQLFMPTQPMEASCSTSNGNQYPGFFNHSETHHDPESTVSHEQTGKRLRPEFESAP